jgi:hypothetical protein
MLDSRRAFSVNPTTDGLGRPMSLRWHFDEFSARCIGGWIDDDGPAATVAVSVNGSVVVGGSPTDYRKDLEDAGIGDGRRAFTFPMSGHLIESNNLVTVSCGDEILASVTMGPISDEVRIAAVVRAAGVKTNQKADILFLQTADATNYLPLFQITSRTVIQYCSRNNLSCQFYIGICRGYQPWHATFNRIILLRRLLVCGFSGWVCYLDADAFIADLNFDIRAYLADKSDTALVIATDQPHVPDRPHWAVNAGTFFINLGNEVGQDIAWRWSENLEAISDERLNNAAEWTFDDQGLLGIVLQGVPPDRITILRGDPNLINFSGGRFIRQIMRTEPHDHRLSLLRSETDRVLEKS